MPHTKKAHMKYDQNQNKVVSEKTRRTSRFSSSRKNLLKLYENIEGLPFFLVHRDINVTDDNFQGPFSQNGSTFKISLNRPF